jgi:hypothetical protein
MSLNARDVRAPPLSRQDAEVRPSGADLVAKLKRHRLAHLRQVMPIVHDPRREQLAHRDRAEIRVRPATVQVAGR